MIAAFFYDTRPRIPDPGCQMQDAGIHNQKRSLPVSQPPNLPVS